MTQFVMVGPFQAHHRAAELTETKHIVYTDTSSRPKTRVFAIGLAEGVTVRGALLFVEKNGTHTLRNSTQDSTNWTLLHATM